MKKVFAILGVIFTVIVVIVAAIFIKLDREATAFIQDVVPKIATNWSSQELVDRATPELKKKVAKARDKFDGIFLMFRRLGSFKHLDKPKGMLGNYTTVGDFEKGKATIKIQLRRVNDIWKINRFEIDSDVFIPSKA